VDLRLEMNTLVVLNTCQHPLDPDTAYHPREVKLEVSASPMAGDNDACRNSRLENVRAFRNTEDYYLLRS